MSHDKWYSKGEVLEDLVAVSGRRSGGDQLRHVTDRPPALAVGNDDETEELLRRFGRSNSFGKTVENPDLEYITGLIAQARAYDNLPDYSNEQETRELTEPESLVVSKHTRLDPTVPVFQPRPGSLGVSPKTNNTVIKKENGNKPENSNGAGEAIPNSSVRKNVRSDIEKATEDLKKTIFAPKENGAIQGHFKRNAAVMSLMGKLAAASPTPLQDTPVNQDPPVIEKEIVEAKIDEVIPQQIAESIEKVDSWLRGPEKTIVPEVKIKKKPSNTVQLTPFTYKKKEKIVPPTERIETPQSFRSSTSAQSSASESMKFVPSKSSDDLYEQFMKQSGQRHIEESGDKTLWGYVEKEMHDRKYSSKNSTSNTN